MIPAQVAVVVIQVIDRINDAKFSRTLFLLYVNRFNHLFEKSHSKCMPPKGGEGILRYGKLSLERIMKFY